MKIQNCGILALEKLQPVDKVSAYSLIQLARENGLNLLIYHVDPKDLVSVPRPVIIHAKDHFLYVKNGEPLPQHEYTGFVLARKGFKGSRVVTHAEAKRIMGAKKGGGAKSIVPAILGTLVGLVAGPAAGIAVGAAANAGMQQYAKAGHPEQLGPPGKPLDILGEAVVGGLEAYGGTKLISGGIAGGTQAAPGFLSKAGGIASGALFGTPAVTGISSGVSTYTPSTSGLLGSGGQLFGSGTAASKAAEKNWLGAFNAATGKPDTAAMSLINGGVGNAAGQPLTLAPVNSGWSMSNIPGLAKQAGGALLSGGVKNLAGNLFNQNSGGGGGGLGLDVGIPELAAVGASQIGKPDTSFLDRGPAGVGSDYSALKTYVGGNSALPQATQDQLMKYVHTPLDQITHEMSFNADPVIRQINTSFDRQVQAATRQFAQAGQTYQDSTDARNSIDQINNERARTIKDATAELQNQALSNAIQAKQSALSQSLQNNQYDSTLALELARIAGQEKELKLAIQMNDYNQFQAIIANLLYMGYTRPANEAAANASNATANYYNTAAQRMAAGGV